NSKIVGITRLFREMKSHSLAHLNNSIAYRQTAGTLQVEAGIHKDPYRIGPTGCPRALKPYPGAVTANPEVTILRARNLNIDIAALSADQHSLVRHLERAGRGIL